MYSERKYAQFGDLKSAEMRQITGDTRDGWEKYMSACRGPLDKGRSERHFRSAC